MTERTIDRQLGQPATPPERAQRQTIPRSHGSRRRQDMDGARLLISGDRVVHGKRYAVEGEALVLSTSARQMMADQPVNGAVLEQAREMLHQSFDRFAQNDGVQLASGTHAGGAGSREQDYHGLLDCVIDDQDVIDPARYHTWIAENLGRSTQSRDGVRDRLILIVVGEMIETDTDLDTCAIVEENACGSLPAWQRCLRRPGTENDNSTPVDRVSAGVPDRRRCT